VVEEERRHHDVIIVRQRILENVQLKEGRGNPQAPSAICRLLDRDGIDIAAIDFDGQSPRAQTAQQRERHIAATTSHIQHPEWRAGSRSSSGEDLRP
jgi:hypothetical protein